MLIQDSLTGRLHEIPDRLYQPYLGEYGRFYDQQYPPGYSYSPQYGAGQVVYDGLGNPVGIFPLLAKLIPLAAKVLPAITSALPAITQALPEAGSLLPGGSPSAPPAAAPMPAPQPLPVIPPPPALMMPMPPVMEPAVLEPPEMPFEPIEPMHPMQPMPVAYPGAMMPPGGIRRLRRRSRRSFRRRIAGPPRELMSVPAVGNVQPMSSVPGWGYYGGFNGYGWR